MEIHQLLPGLHYGDAISNEVLTLRGLLRSWGHASEIFADTWQDRMAHECHPYKDYAPGSGAVTIYHYSIGSEGMTEVFRQAPGKKVLIYHNITPPEFLERYHDDAYAACKEGREALGDLAAVVDLALGDSGYNCRELADHGFRDPRVLPIPVDFGRFDATAPCPRTVHRYADGWTNFLFVGRLVPNKCPKDVVRAFAHYNRRIDRRSRLLLVGSPSGMVTYGAELAALIASLGLDDHVITTGHVRFRELVAYYRLADVFVCMSEHEGFCVPLLEALYCDVPVLAYAAAAVPDTLGDAGLLVTRKDFPEIAELAHLVVTDQDLRDRLICRQEERLADFEPAKITRQFRAYLDEVLAG